MVSLTQSMEKWLFRLSYRFEKVQLTSKAFVYAYFIIKLLLGIPIIMLIRIGNVGIYPDITKQLNKYMVIPNLINIQLCIWIVIPIIIVFGFYLLLIIKLILMKQDQNGVIASVSNILTIIFDALSFVLFYVVGQLLWYGFQLQKERTSIVSTIAAVQILLFAIYYERLYISFSLQEKNAFSKLYKHASFAQGIVKLLIAGMMGIMDFQQQAQRIIVVSLTIVILIPRLYSGLCQVSFHSQFTQRVNILKSLIQFNCSLIMIIYLLSDIPLLSDNFVVMLILITLFFFLAITSYRQFHIQEIVFNKVYQIKDEQKAIFFIKQFYRLSKPSLNNNQFIITSLIKDHFIHCKKIDCYCKVAYQNISNRDRASKHLNTQLIKVQYINDMINQLQAQMNKSSRVLIASAFLKLQAFQRYPKVIHFYKKLSMNNTHIGERYAAYVLQSQIQKLIQEKTKKNRTLQIQDSLLLDDLLKKIRQKMYQTANSMLKKYQYLSKKLCRITQIQMNSNYQLKLMKDLHDIYLQNLYKFKKSKEFNMVYYLYFDKIFFLQPQLNQIKKNITQSQKKFRINQILDAVSLNKVLFIDKVAVIDTMIQRKALGKITKVSKTVYAVLGYSPPSMIGMNIASLMPQFMVHQHNQHLKKWYQTGSWESIGKVIQIYAINKKKQAFQSLIYLKIRQGTQGIHLTSLLLNKNEDDFIIFNHKGQIQNLGKKAGQYIGPQSQGLPGHFIFNQLRYMRNTGNKQRKMIQTKAVSFKKVSIDLISEYLQNRIHQWTEDIDQRYFKKFNEIGLTKYHVRLNYFYYHFGKLSFLVLQILEINEMDSDIKIKDLRFKDEISIVSDQKTNKLTIKTKNKINQQIQQGGSSVNSSREGQNFALNKMIFKFMQCFFNPSEVYDSRLMILTIVLFVLFVLLIALVISSKIIYNLGLFSVSQIMFANGQVSNNMQLTQFMYNNLMMVKQQTQLNNKTDLDSTILSGQTLQNSLYTLVSTNMKFLFKNVTDLSGYSYYQYLKTDQTWNFPNNPHKANIASNQFLQFYYYNSIQGLQQQRIDKSLKMMLINFQEMKRINQYNLDEYLNLVLNSLDILNICFYISIGVYALITFLVGIFLHRFFKFRFQQCNRAFQLYKFLTQRQIDILKEYYKNILEYMKFISASYQTLNSFEEDKNLQLNLKNNDNNFMSGNSGNYKFKLVNNKSYISFIWIIVLVIALNGSNAFINLDVKNIFEPAQEMANSQAHLMESENLLLQAYFDLKAYNLIDDQNMPMNKFFQNLLERIKIDEVLFNKYATQKIMLYENYQAGFEDDFIDILIEDLCTIISRKVQQYSINKCKKQLYYNIVNSGILASMDFFQRQLQQAVIQFVDQQQQTKNATAFFQQKQFKDIDISIIFMFKAYQTLQDRVFVTLNTAIEQKIKFSLYGVIGQVIIFILFLVIWTMMIQKHKKQLAQIYGYTLLIPPKLIKQNKNIVRQVQENLQFRNL